MVVVVDEMLLLVLLVLLLGVKVVLVVLEVQGVEVARWRRLTAQRRLVGNAQSLVVVVVV